MLFALDICVIKKAPATHSLNPPPLHLKNITLSFFSFLPCLILNLQTIQAPFLGDSPAPLLPPQKIIFSCTEGVFRFLSELP